MLKTLTEAYKNEIGNIQCTKQLPMEDLDQMFNEIDKADNLQDFIDVVGRWSQDAIRIGGAMVILKIVIDLNDQ